MTEHTFPVDIWLRGEHTATTRNIHGIVREPGAWTDDDVRSMLEGMLTEMHRLKHPDDEHARFALRGLSWIVNPYEEGGVVVAIEITLGAAIAGPFQIEQRRFSKDDYAGPCRGECPGTRRPLRLIHMMALRSSPAIILYTDARINADVAYWLQKRQGSVRSCSSVVLRGDGCRQERSSNPSSSSVPGSCRRHDDCRSGPSRPRAWSRFGCRMIGCDPPERISSRTSCCISRRTCWSLRLLVVSARVLSHQDVHAPQLPLAGCTVVTLNAFELTRAFALVWTVGVAPPGSAPAASLHRHRPAPVPDVPGCRGRRRRLPRRDWCLRVRAGVGALHGHALVQCGCRSTPLPGARV